MKAERWKKAEGRKKRRSGLRVSLLVSASAIAVLFGIMGSHEASLKAENVVAIAPARTVEAPATTAQDYPSDDEKAQTMKGHSELDLQPD